MRYAMGLGILFSFAAGHGDAAVPLPQRPGNQKVDSVAGFVRMEGVHPAPKKHLYDQDMWKYTGEKYYTDETWLIGRDNGLANCVVTLQAKDSEKRIKAAPLPPQVFLKAGVRYVPRVLVVTPGTEVVCTNKDSPCRGFSSAATR